MKRIMAAAIMGCLTGFAFADGGELGVVSSAARYSAATYGEGYSVYQWKETRAQFGVGPMILAAQGARPQGFVDLDLRYRLSPAPWPESDAKPWHLGPLPLNLLMELGGTVPTTPSSFRNETHTEGTSVDRAESKTHALVHLSLINQLPLGKEDWFIPELGFGVAAASLETVLTSETLGTYSVYGFTYPNTPDYARGSQTQWVASPYIRFGIHLFSKNAVSLNLSASYVNFPNRSTFPVLYSYLPQNNHTQSYDRRLSGWTILPMLTVKLLWPSSVNTPLIPRQLPPWLMPAYTTDPISPWVASSEIANDPQWKKPGHPSVGNVMFQYRNKWVEDVAIIGDFNDWTPEPMVKDQGGMWVAVKDLPSGTFHYNYVLNGKKEILDPWNTNADPDSRTHGSSVVKIP